MTLSEFEALVVGQTESPTLEFKGPSDWGGALVKDILAMSNCQDGGVIVIGIKDDTLERLGLTAEQAASYDIEKMRDFLRDYADPYVTLSKDTIVDASGRTFVVLRVAEFDDVPVICRRDSAYVLAGRIYFRSRTRRVESAPISNATEMRDIVERSTVKRMRRIRQLGLTVTPSHRKELDRELEGL